MNGSESCYSEAEMQEILNELERSIEDREQKQRLIEQLQQEMSELSLQNSELVNELRNKSEIIKSLNARIGTLSESDKVLKLNAELRRQNKLLRTEAAATVTAVREEYRQKEAELAETQAAADTARNEAEAARSRQNELIEEKATQAYSSRKTALEREYKAKTGGYHGFLIGCLLYGVLTTAFTAVRSDRFVSDFVEFFTKLWAGVRWIGGAVWQLGQAAAELGDKIQNPTAAVVVHWLLLVVVVGGIGAAMLGGLIWGSKKLLGFYIADYADAQSLAAFLISLAVVVFFAEPIKSFIPLNLLVVLLLVHAAYIAVRWYVKGWKRARGYY